MVERDEGHDAAERTGAWINQNVGMCLTAVRNRDRRTVPVEFVGACFDLPSLAAPAEETFHEAFDPDTYKVRIGTRDEWTYAVEIATVRGADPKTLRRLSADGREAISLCCNPKLDWFWYASDGQMVCGFEVPNPDTRHGDDPHRFDEQIARAACRRRPGNPEPPPRGSSSWPSAWNLIPRCSNDACPASSCPSSRRKRRAAWNPSPPAQR
jgi:hypothetical protein